MRFSDQEILKRQKAYAEGLNWWVFCESFPEGESAQVCGPMSLGDARYIAAKIEADNNHRVLCKVADTSTMNWADALELRHDHPTPNEVEP